MVVNTGVTGKDSECGEQNQDTLGKGFSHKEASTKGKACLKASIFFNFILLTLLCGTGFYISYTRQKYCKMVVEHRKTEMQLKGLNYEVKGCKVYPIETKRPNPDSLQDDNIKTVRVSSSSQSPYGSNSFTLGKTETRSPRSSEPESSKTSSPSPRISGSSKTRSPRPSEPGSSNTRSPSTKKPESSETRSSRPRKPGSPKTRSPLLSDFESIKTRSPRPSESGSPSTLSSVSSEPVSSKTRSPLPDEPEFPETESLDAKPDENLVPYDPEQMLLLWSILNEKDYEDAMPMPGAIRIGPM